MLLEVSLMRLLLVPLFMLLMLADRGYAEGAQLARFATGDLVRLSFRQAGTAAPATVFQSKTGPVTLAQFKGKVVVLNLWATWCAPCLKELPGLDRLATTLKTANVVVLAVSEDKAAWRAIDPWWRTAKLATLVPYSDKAMDLGFGYRAAGLPMTVIYDGRGQEVARLNGGAAWDSANAVALLRAVAAAK
jgi:thiol-disulfide isomerase/thioredoxin